MRKMRLRHFNSGLFYFTVPQSGAYFATWYVPFLSCHANRSLSRIMKSTLHALLGLDRHAVHARHFANSQKGAVGQQPLVIGRFLLVKRGDIPSFVARGA